jgi:hypothetical protein
MILFNETNIAAPGKMEAARLAVVTEQDWLDGEVWPTSVERRETTSPAR